ncbi:MAG: methyltransferase domain-containing protein [Ignavibacteriales bacterium]|nr:MAG: methyltransferase domain-containing protein [Ignavibacteriales bacterium]
MSALVDKASFWNSKYVNSESNWDLNSPNPVFIELLKDSSIIKPGKILIAGCGKGYDAIAVAKAGFDVTAVDFSSFAIDFTRDLAAANAVKITLIEKDIFELDETVTGQFDYIYDYVTYCAINPDRRKEYAIKIASLIKPGGKFIALFFPVEKRDGGPPFGITLIDTYKIFNEYLKLEYSEKLTNSIKPRMGREVLQLYKK